MNKKLHILLIAISLCLPSTLLAGNPLKWFAENWSAIDSNYVEPSRYDWSLTLIHDMSQEFMDVKSPDYGMAFNLRSHPSQKLGPSFGYQWLCGGVSYDFNAHIEDKDRQKSEFSLNVFSQLFNIDIFYRNTGGDFYFKKMYMGGTPEFNGYKFTDVLMSLQDDFAGDMIKTRIVGANAFYVFNHRKFSYPAAWSNSSQQKISAGSPLAGFGYTYHRVENNFGPLASEIPVLQALLLEYFPSLKEEFAKHQFTFDKICSIQKFRDWTIWGGYAYNWVPCRNVLIGASATLGLGFKQQYADNKDFLEYAEEYNNKPTTKYQISKPAPIVEKTNLVDFNGVGRFSALWNNNKFYAGGKFNYNFYRYYNANPALQCFNSFYTMELFLGVKFGEQKWFKEKKKRMNNN